jgi:hypothetical protein
MQHCLMRVHGTARTEMKPDDANAGKYLDATRQRMAQLGLRPLPPPPDLAPPYLTARAGLRQASSPAAAAALQPGSAQRDATAAANHMSADSASASPRAGAARIAVGYSPSQQ